MENYHDLFVMVCTAGALYGAIRYDLKFLRFNLTNHINEYKAHLKKYHGENNG
jgi:hypothetical protein